MEKKRKPGFYALFQVNFKFLAAACVALVMGATAVTAVFAMERGEGVKVPIVMYHSLLKDEKYHGKYVVSPAEFETDVQYLKKHGYTTVLIEDLIAYTKGGELPEKPVVLTFDDGYYNNYLYAFPIAEKYRCKFVISPIGRYAELYSESGEKNAYYSHACWEELREMAGSGLVEIGNHSYDLHSERGGALGAKKLPGETPAQYKARLTNDVEKAQSAVLNGTGVKPVTFVYPFGAMSRETPEIIKSLGFSATLSCEERVSIVTRDPESLYGLGRFLRPSGETSAQFFEKILS